MKKCLLLGMLAALPMYADAPLADAVLRQDRARVEALLAKKADVNARQVDGMTALHWAAMKEDVAAAKALLKAGADAQATNRYGIPPLWLACQNGNGAIVEMPLAAGADPNTRLRGGESA